MGLVRDVDPTFAKPTAVMGWLPVAESATSEAVTVALVPVGNVDGVAMVMTRLHVAVVFLVKVPRLTARVKSLPVAAGLVPPLCT
jgi:hypothetical protein